MEVRHGHRVDETPVHDQADLHGAGGECHDVREGAHWKARLSLDVKGDDRSFFKMATMKILFWLYSFSNYIL